MLSQIISSVIEAALNQYLRLDPDAFARCATLSGKVIAVNIKGMSVTLYFLPDSEGIQVMQNFDGDVDATINGTPFSLLRMKLDEQGRDALFEGDVTIEGDVRTGQAFNRLLESVDVNWEEHLSHLTGDMVAHGLGNKIRQLLSWGKESGQSVRDDVAEYLHEESRDLPVRDEVERFMDGVDVLRADVERFELKMARLFKKMDQASS